jgi:hypothetical protein
MGSLYQGYNDILVKRALFLGGSQDLGQPRLQKKKKMEGGVAAEGGGLEELSQDQSLNPSPSQLQQCTEGNQANVL